MGVHLQNAFTVRQFCSFQHIILSFPPLLFSNFSRLLSQCFFLGTNSSQLSVTHSREAQRATTGSLLPGDASQYCLLFSDLKRWYNGTRLQHPLLSFVHPRDPSHGDRSPFSLPHSPPAMCREAERPISRPQLGLVTLLCSKSKWQAPKLSSPMYSPTEESPECGQKNTAYLKGVLNLEMFLLVINTHPENQRRKAVRRYSRCYDCAGMRVKAFSADAQQKTSLVEVNLPQQIPHCSLKSRPALLAPPRSVYSAEEDRSQGYMNVQFWKEIDSPGFIKDDKRTDHFASMWAAALQA